VGQGAVTLHPKLVSVSSTTATVVDCIYSTSELVYQATGKPVPPVTPPENDGVNATLVLTGAPSRSAHGAVHDPRRHRGCARHQIAGGTGGGGQRGFADHVGQRQVRHQPGEAPPRRGTQDDDPNPGATQQRIQLASVRGQPPVPVDDKKVDAAGRLDQQPGQTRSPGPEVLVPIGRHVLPARLAGHLGRQSSHLPMQPRPPGTTRNFPAVDRHSPHPVV
jgi:hypothetical protein